MTIYVIVRITTGGVPILETARLTHDEAATYVEEQNDRGLRVIHPLDMPLTREAPRIMAATLEDSHV